MGGKLQISIDNYVTNWGKGYASSVKCQTLNFKLHICVVIKTTNVDFELRNNAR